MKLEDFPREQDILRKHIKPSAPMIVESVKGHLQQELEDGKTAAPSPKEHHHRLARTFVSFIEKSQPPEKE